MSDNTENPAPQFPGNWRIAADYDPNQHLMNLKGRDYLNVQNRLLWFIRDQRDFIVRGLATTSYCIKTELVEQDREAGFAHFKTYVRDVLGNEAVMYGSESAKDFADYAEKASTKSLGRALLALGYGTAFAPEMDEGDRIVDSPVERKPSQSAFPARPPVIHAPADEPTPTPTPTPAALKSGAATDEQRELMRQKRNILHILDKTVERADNILNARQADERIKAYDQYIADRQQKAGAR